MLIEKPMALTLDGADEIIRAQRESGKVVFVGYMRRYAAAFLRVKEMLQSLQPGKINYGTWLALYSCGVRCDNERETVS